MKLSTWALFVLFPGIMGITNQTLLFCSKYCPTIVMCHIMADFRSSYLCGKDAVLFARLFQSTKKGHNYFWHNREIKEKYEAIIEQHKDNAALESKVWIGLNQVWLNCLSAIPTPFPGVIFKTKWGWNSDRLLISTRFYGSTKSQKVFRVTFWKDV